MTMVIYWANENAPNGGTSSKSIQILAVRRNVAKEKTFLEEKIYRSHALYGTRV